MDISDIEETQAIAERFRTPFAPSALQGMTLHVRLAAVQESDSIDVAAILAQIRTEVQGARAGLTDETAHLALGVDLDELRDSIAEVEALRAVTAHWPLEGHTLRGRVATFVQRIVRRGLQWYILPIVQQQNAYNAAVARALQLLLDSQLELAREVARLRTGTDAAPSENASQ